MTDTAQTQNLAGFLHPDMDFEGGFRLTRYLGSGAMGVVYAARDLDLDRDVALKIMRPAALDSGSDAETHRETRFQREAKLTASLDHPSILPIYRFGIDEATGFRYFAMRLCLLSEAELLHVCDEVHHCPYPRQWEKWDEDLRALSLADLLEGGKALPEKAVARIGLDLLGALVCAHASDPPVIHRDIKPSNVLFTPEGKAMLADFGIAKQMGGAVKAENTTSDETPAGTRRSFVGTYAYAAPEHLETGRAVPASDFYSLGVVLYRALTGTLPRSLKTPSEFDPRHISRQWDSLLSRMLEPDPARRRTDEKTIGAVLRGIARKRRFSPGRAAVWTGIGLAALLAVGMVLRPAAPESPRTLHVAAEADIARADGSRRHPYGDLQTAIQNAKDGGRVSVAPGDYTGAFVIEGKSLNLVSEAGPEKTVLRGIDGHSVLFLSESATNSFVSGFTFTEGMGHTKPSSYGTDFYGGGVCCHTSARFLDCVFMDNGAGVLGKSATTFGGGLYACNGTVSMERCRFRGNGAWASGGAAFVESGTLDLTDCEFSGNRRTVEIRPEVFGNTGGVGLCHGASLTLRRCVFSGNSGDDYAVFHCVETGDFLSSVHVEDSTLEHRPEPSPYLREE